MKRMGMVIGIKPERIEEYKKTHAAVWPEVLAKIADCNMRNYTIFLREPENLLFGYFEYHGRRLGGGFSQDGGRSEDAGMVGDSRTHAGSARHPQGRRLVGHGGGGVSHRLSLGQRASAAPLERLPFVLGLAAISKAATRTAQRARPAFGSPRVSNSTD